jgi:signal transduction histidine kinase
VRNRAERDTRFPRVSEALASFDSVVAIPLAARGRVIGSLSMHRVESEPLTEDALQFMQLLAFQTAQALERVMLYEAELAARVKADDANRAKSEFLAAMSHELRTPLNAIGGYAELIDMGVRGPVTQQQHDDLRRITASQQHLLSIINDILNFSRVDAGKIDFYFASICVADILESVAHMIEPQAAARGLTLIVDDCPRDLAVWADKPKVDQILLNLLSNAVKFTSAGEVRLSCRVDDERRVTIEVSDSGMGIAPDQIDRIFEPFVQVGRSLTNTREGAGLGLAISRELARGMHGDITAQSAIGTGSTFRLTLPLSSGSSAD